MKSFIFYTNDGFTYDSNHHKANNMQILGHGEGKDVLEALEQFKTHQSYLSKQAFRNVMALQTVGDSILNLEL